MPEGIDGACDKATGEGGCPPRAAADPPIYNRAAAKALEIADPGGRVATLDLFEVVTKKCGANYTLCPEGCSAKNVNGTWEGDCYQIPVCPRQAQPGSWLRLSLCLTCEAVSAAQRALPPSWLAGAVRGLSGSSAEVTTMDSFRGVSFSAPGALLWAC